MDEQRDHSTKTPFEGEASFAKTAPIERRLAIKSMAAITALAAATAARADTQPGTQGERTGRGPFIAGADGNWLFYRDWGHGGGQGKPQGKSIVFCHPWGLNSEIWEYQLIALSEQGVRCVAYDRRGHGRSEDPGHGYDFGTLAADLAAVIEQLDLRDVTLVGYSMGSAEAIHYVSHYGKDRIARLVLTSPVAPFREDRSMFDGLIAGLKKDRPATLAGGLPFFLGRDSQASPAMTQWVLDQFLTASPKASIECTRSIASTDHRALLGGLKVPVLIIQGDHDELAPLERTRRMLVEAIPGSELRVYEGAPHGIALTHRDRFTHDLLGFVGGS
jgi:pimeloyl-ACP methyl ester carboxylesterase